MDISPSVCRSLSLVSFAQPVSLNPGEYGSFDLTLQPFNALTRRSHFPRNVT